MPISSEDTELVKGIYVLHIHLPEEQEITLGRRQNVRFLSGYYAYIGSALNGLNSRLNRHLSKDKKFHWHIDYLLEKAFIRQIITSETEDRIECALAQALLRRFDFVSGFGASDCRCSSHLIFSNWEMKGSIMTAFSSLGVTPVLSPIRISEE